jgi:hypothetical protein
MKARTRRSRAMLPIFISIHPPPPSPPIRREPSTPVKKGEPRMKTVLAHPSINKRRAPRHTKAPAQYIMRPVKMRKQLLPVTPCGFRSQLIKESGGELVDQGNETRGCLLRLLRQQMAPLLLFPSHFSLFLASTSVSSYFSLQSFHPLLSISLNY